MHITGFKQARILIVDDEAANVELLRRLLERAGFSEDVELLRRMLEG